jgi:hypothetical protein
VIRATSAANPDQLEGLQILTKGTILTNMVIYWGSVNQDCKSRPTEKPDQAYIQKAPVIRPGLFAKIYPIYLLKASFSTAASLSPAMAS